VSQRAVCVCSRYDGSCVYCGAEWDVGDYIFTEGSDNGWSCSRDCAHRRLREREAEEEAKAEAKARREAAARAEARREAEARERERQREEEARRAPPPPPPDTRLWPYIVLEATPCGWRTRVYKALARILHPDAGGDTALAAALNDARDQMAV
jgi:hypothetical protein